MDCNGYSQVVGILKYLQVRGQNSGLFHVITQVFLVLSRANFSHLIAWSVYFAGPRIQAFSDIDIDFRFNRPELTVNCCRRWKNVLRSIVA